MSSNAATNLPVTLTSLDLREIELACTRSIISCGLVNGHPITPTERQGIAIRTVLTAGERAVKVLLAKGAGATGSMLEQVLEQLKKEFAI